MLKTRCFMYSAPCDATAWPTQLDLGQTPEDSAPPRPRRAQRLGRRGRVPAGSWLLASGLALGLQLLAAPALAEGVSPEQATQEELNKAQAAYAAAVENFEARRFKEAAKGFGASLGVVASPNARLMYARALRESGDLAAAFEQMAQTQRDAAHLAERMPKYAPTAEKAEAELKDLRARVASLSIEIKNGTAVEVWVGQRKVPQILWRGVAVEPGTVHVVARLPGGRRAWQAVQASVGVGQTVVLDLTSPVEGPADVIPWLNAKSDSTEGPNVTPEDGGPEGNRDPRGDQPPYMHMAYIAAGVGGVGILTFAVAGLMSQSTHSELESTCPGGACPPGNEGLVDRGRREQTIANVGLGLGVLGGGAAVVFYLLDQQGEGRARTDSASGLRIGTNFVAYSGRF